MIRYLALLLILVGAIGCSSDVQPESISAEKAKAAQEKMETANQGSEAAPSQGGAQENPAADQ